MENRKIQILIVDDDEDDFVLLKSYFEEIRNHTFELTWTQYFDDALVQMKKNTSDLYIIDYLMGRHTGLELLQKGIDGGCTKPIIILTGKGSHEVDVEAMRLGASDFLIKGQITAEKLERSIRYALERYENIKALTESEAKYRNLFESSRDMIYITDDDGNFVDVNDSVTRIFGYKRTELLGEPAAVLYLNDEDRNKFLNALKISGILHNYEVVLKDFNGDKKLCLVSASIQYSANGRYYIIGVIHDITRRRQAERDLVVAEKLAMTGRVSRMLAHEVRNPLTNINLTVEQLEYESKNPEFTEYFAMIKRNSKRINDLITELLVSSKPAEVTKHRHELHNVIDDSLLLANDRIALKNIRVERNYTDPCELMVDDQKIKTALLNIIINAVEAVSENNGMITIRTFRKEERCYIEISDNGVGVASQDISRLFEPYYTGKEGGLGLGLSTTHNIIVSHEGTITVESEINTGTKFLIGLNI